MAHFIVTGGCGFLGTWIIRQLLNEGDAVTVFDVQKNTKRWEMVLSHEEIARIHFRTVKMEETAEVLAAAGEIQPDGIIHLAGLQVPACRENPVLGAKVNVIGTLNVFEAAKARRKSSPTSADMRLVYASSAAVFGPDAEYPEGSVGDDAAPRPANHYGAYKLCNENCAKAYWLTDKLGSIGLRPLTIYGPGRDTGMTSFPTRAIAAAMLKRSFDIPFKGPTAYIHAREVADMFVRCAKRPIGGAHVYTVGGDIVDTASFLEALEKVLPGSQRFVTASGGDLPITQRLDDAALRRDYPGLLRIPLQQGLVETVEVFSRLAKDGKLEACL
jgi:nucleoside-diphosphate-sugar epimerase